MRKYKRRLLRDTMSAAIHEDDVASDSFTDAFRAKEETDSALESGIYVAATKDEPAHRVSNEVTLIVYGWYNVEPGTLSWVFPSYDSALTAAQAMKNAVRWAIVAGERISNLEDARSHGELLAEQV